MARGDLIRNDCESLSGEKSFWGFSRGGGQAREPALLFAMMR